MFEQLRARPVARSLDSRWWIGGLRSLFAVLFSVAAFLRPGGALEALLLSLGAYALAEGITALVIGTLTGWRAMLLASAAGILTGAFAFTGLATTPLAFAAIVAAWMLLRGGLDMLTEILLQREMRGEWQLAASGVGSILFAGAALVLPPISASGAGLLVETIGLVEGALFLALTLRLYRVEHRARASA